MNLTTLPTQSSSNSDSDTPLSAVSDHVESLENSASPKTIAPNTIILAEALTDTTISWQIHNCKISEKNQLLD